jgi:hypothetical protein
MKKTGLTLALMGLSLGCTWACECIKELTETLKQKVEIASVIFYGEVVSITDIDKAKPISQTYKEYGFEQLDKTKSGFHPQFRVIDVLKGDLKKEMEQDLFKYQGSLSVCSDIFKVGEKYLVLANRDEDGKVLLRICNPPLTFEDRKAYLKVKREILRIKDFE